MMRTDFDAPSFRRGLLREGLAHLAHGVMFGFGYLPNRHRPTRARDIRTVVFVHGLGANRSGFFPLQAYLRFRGFNRQLSLNGCVRDSIEGAALHLKRRLDEEVRGGSIDLICHSLGGLVGRYYVQMLGGHRRVERLITLGTPHHGTHPSVYLPSKLLWQLKPGGSFIAHLNAQPPPSEVATWSFAAAEDHLVLPGSAALAPFGETATFAEIGHQGLLLSPRVFAAVRDALSS